MHAKPSNPFARLIGCLALLAFAAPLAWPQSPAAPAAAPAPKQQPVTILEETLIRVMTADAVDSKRSRRGTPLEFLVSEDVVVGESLAIPRGTKVRGVVMRSKKPGRLTGTPELTMELTALELGGRNYPLYTHQFKVVGASKTKPTEVKAVRGAAVGTVVGSIVGGASTKGGSTQVTTGNPVSMLAGAAAGAGVGTAVSALSPGPGIHIPSEAEVDFYLASPITVTPVSDKEAERLGEGLRRGGPVLYLRGETP
jgi:hypothetical protein